MGWSIGRGSGRDIGYGVPATCDQPKCNKKIDRGMSYACGSFRSDDGCGLYFCGNHLYFGEDQNGDTVEFCDVCLYNLEHLEYYDNMRNTYEPKPDRKVWVRWKLTHSSWQQWRDENQDEVNDLIKLYPDIKIRASRSRK